MITVYHCKYFSCNYYFYIFEHKTGSTKPADVSLKEEHYHISKDYLDFVCPVVKPNCNRFFGEHWRKQNWISWKGNAMVSFGQAEIEKC